jgi:dTDP-glucose 4,6-dehydratase
MEGRPALITGGCGFIGSNFIRYVLASDPAIRVINLDALTYAGDRANLVDIETDSSLSHRYRFIHADITDRDVVRDGVRDGVCAIINFAAETHVDQSIADSGRFVRTNVLGTQVLLDVARQLGVPRYVQVSTDEVYGSLGPTGRFSEGSPLAPNNPYSASKAAADLLVRSYAHTFGLDAVITRCSNNYGSYQFPEKLIPLAVLNLLRGAPVPIYGDGLNVRDWIHVRDHCRGIDLAWRKGRAGEVYNFGGRAERTNLELVHAILRIMGMSPSLVRFVTDRPGHDRRYAMDTTKAEHDLAWRPEWNLEDGLAATIDWYRNHREWAERAIARISGKTPEK